MSTTSVPPPADGPVDPTTVSSDATVNLILQALRQKAGAVARDEPTAQVPDAVAGRMIGGYRLVRRLGRGGMAEVHEAIHLRLRRPVALKLLVLDDDRREMAPRFLREARAMVQVRHQNITTIHEAGVAEGIHFLAMELITGGDLGGRIAREGVIPVDEAIRLMIGCCEGLAALHAAGLVHRDIKPGNIFLTASGEPKIGDFGLARQASGADRMTVTGAAWGTPSYMAPEQIVGAADVDARADLYALGATLYTMVTGREPFSGETAYLTTFKAMTEPFPDPRLLNPAVPVSVATIIRMATDHERERRYSSARAMREDLQRAQGQQMLLHASTVGVAAPTAARPVPVGTKPPRIDPPTRTALPSGAANWSRRLLLAGALVAGVAWWWPAGTAKPAAAEFPAWATSGGVDGVGRWVELTVGSATTRLRYCPAGSFMMGSPEGEAGRSSNETHHQVTLTRGFWMQETECDQALYQAVVGENPSRHRGAALPVEQTTWDDAQEFCALLVDRGVPARLPTEAEWEYACRAGSDGPFAGPTPAALGWMADGRLLQMWQMDGGGEAAARQYGDTHQSDLTLRAHPVARRSANAAGFFDMHGNVLEWCADRWDGQTAHGRGAQRDPRSEAGEFAVVRGGSWFHPAIHARSAARMGLETDTKRDYLGFRFVIADHAATPIP